MNLEEIKSTLEESVKNKSLSLTKTVLDAIGVDGVLRSALNGEDLVFRNVIISGTDKVVISGDSDVYGFDVSGQLQISRDKSGLLLGLQARTPDSSEISLPGVSWLKVSGLNLSLTAYPSSKKVDGKLKGTVGLGNLQLPVEISIPLEDGKLFLQSAFDKVKVPDLNDLKKVLTQAGLLDYLPQGLDLTGVSLSDLGVMFNPKGGNVSFFSLALNCPGPWKFADGKVSVKDLKASITVGDAKSPDRKVGVSCSAMLNLGDTGIPVQLVRDPSKAICVISIPPENPVPLPGLSALVELAAGRDFSIPDGFSRLKNPQLTGFKVVFDEKTKALGEFSAGIRISQDWDLFQGKVSVGNPYLDLGVTTGQDKKRKIEASIGGNLRLGKTDVPLLAQNKGDGVGWRFKGDFKDAIPFPDLKTVLKQLGTEALAQALPRGLDVLDGLGLTDLAIPFDAVKNIPQSITLSMGYSKGWSLPNLDQFSVNGLSLNLTVHFGGDQGKGITGNLGGTLQLDTIPVQLTAVKGNLKSAWVFSAVLSGGGEVGLRKTAGVFLPKPLSIPKEVPDIIFDNVSLNLDSGVTTFTLSAKSGSTWDLPLGIGGLTLRNLQLTIAKDGKKAATVVLGARVALGGVELGLDYQVPGDLKLSAKLPNIRLSGLLQDACGADLFKEIPIPPVISSLGLRDAVFTANVTEKTLTLSGSSDLGDVGIKVQREGGKTGTGKWGFSCEFNPPKDFKPSSIGSGLGFLDKVSLSDFGLVLSSAAISKYEFEGLRKKAETVAVSKGLNLITRLDLSGLGADKILNKSSLMVHAALSSNLSNTVLEAQLGGMVKLSKTVAFGNMTLRLYPSPSNFGLQLIGELEAQVDSSSLRFFGSMEITIMEATMAATMKGEWTDPFGVKRVAISDVSLELGLTYEPLLPVLGIAGSLQIGDFAGSAAVKFDPVHVDQCMLAVAFNRLFLMDVIKAFCGSSVVSSIPKGLATTVLDIGFEDVKIYIVPNDTKIGELSFEKGITLQGKMYLWGLTAAAYFNVDQTKGVVAHAEVDAIKILDGAFVMQGAKGAKKAIFDLELQVGKKPGIEISASLVVLGISQDVLIGISESGFLVGMEGKIFDLFQCSLAVSGKDFKSGGDFYVKAVMKSDLMGYLRDKTTEAIQAGANAAISKLTDAQGKVKEAQAQVDKLNGTIRDMRKTIQDERDRDAKRLKDAQDAVASAQDKVNSINKTIDSMRATVRAERERDSGRLKSAQEAVASAQRNVDSIQGNINGLNGQIDGLKRDINDLKREIDNASIWTKAYYGIKNGAIITAKGVQITGLYTAIGTLEASKYTAIGVLEAAKQALRGIQAAADNIPIDADPRVIALLGSREVALGTLEAAKLTLKGMEEAAKNIPIEMDPRMVGLLGSKATADAALITAQQFLEGIKISIGALADVATYIAKFGLGGLIDVKEASFEGHLNMAKGGEVSMGVSVSFMGQKAQTLGFSFNFKDPLSGAMNLAKSLVPSLA